MSNKKKKKINEEIDSLGVKETLKIAFWSLKLSMQVDKTKTVSMVILTILRMFEPIGDIYIVSKLFGQLFDMVTVPGTTINSFFPLIGILLGYKAIYAFISFIDNYTIESLDEFTRTRMPKMTYQKIQSLGIQKLEDADINNLITRARDSMYSIPDFVRMTINIIGRIFILIVSIIIVVRFSPLLIPIIFLVAIPERLVNNFYLKKVYKFSRENTENYRKNSYTIGALQSVSMLPEIIINRSISFLDKKYTEFREWATKENNSITFNWYLKTSVFGILKDIGIYAGYILIFAKALQKVISMSDVFFQTQMLNRLAGNIDAVLGRTGSLFQRAIRINDAYKLFHLEEEVVTGVIKLPKLEEGPDIEFRDLVFSYPSTGKKVINNLNLTIKSGQKVAIVGINGAGKTTLMKLLCNVYEPTKGEIRINGYPLKDIDNSTWYNNLGALFQDFNKHFELSVKENIIIGNPNTKVDMIKLVEAAKSADAFDFIDEYPNKFDQLLESAFKGGIKPSGGQWQKIALARFFYRDAPMVIFDEPTAAIDAESEYKIFNKIYKFFKGKTVIIISHRFSTVRNADRILVLDKGKIIEDGTHEELLALNGKYAHSFGLQAEGYK